MRNIILLLVLFSVTECTCRKECTTIAENKDHKKNSYNADVESYSRDSDMVGNDDCLYDYNSLDDSEFKGKFDYDIYIWDDANKTAKVLFKNSQDSLIIKMYACIHKGISIELFYNDSNTLEIMQSNFNNYLEKVVHLSRFIISDKAFTDLEKDLVKIAFSDGYIKNERIFFDVNNEQFTYCGFVISKVSTYSTSIFFEYYN